MVNFLKKEIIAKCNKQFRKERARKNRENELRERFRRRTNLAPKMPKRKTTIIPDRYFNPSYVKRNANIISRLILRDIDKGQYRPRTAICISKKKPTGGSREIMIFAPADNALASAVFKRVSHRNAKKGSPSSFAYHPTRNVFDAIISLREFRPTNKLFSVQIDFSNYFDSIPHSYIRKIYKNRSIFSITPSERQIFNAFLTHTYEKKVKGRKTNIQKRTIGTPQGSSISLILANLASHELDIALASSGGKFVRFADDVNAFANDYSNALKIEEAFKQHCRNSGIRINEKKSPGISIISKKEQEIRTTSSLKYLGYDLTEDGLTIPQTTISKYKAKISRLLNLHLTYYLKFGYNPDRSGISPDFDNDLLGFVAELRRTLYGGLSERQISDFLQNKSEINRMKGIMGFYCLLESSESLRSLDGWVVNVTRRAMVRRREILKVKYSRLCPTPSNISLIKGDWYDHSLFTPSFNPDPRIPSFVRGWRAARKFYFTRGLENVEPPRYGGSDVFNSVDFFSYGS